MLRLSLRTKLLLAFAVVLLPVLGLLLVNFQSDRQARRENVLDDQTLTAQAVAVQIDEAFDAAVGVGWAVANDPLAQTMDPAVLDPHLQLLVARHPLYDAINVFDARGLNRGWGQLTEPAEPRLDISDRAFFIQVMETNRPVISDVLLLRRPIIVGIVASVPVRGPDDRPIGVVNVVTRTDQMANRYKLARLRPGQAILLADRTGRLAFHTSRPDLPYDVTDDYADFAPLQRALAGKPAQRAQFESPIMGDVRLGAFVPTPKYNWAVGVTVPVAEALADTERRFREQLLILAAIALLSVVLAVFLARLLTRPVRELAEGARDLGRGNLARRVDIRTGDELERLGESFNKMATQLEQRQGDVRRLQAEAERRAGQLAAVIASMLDAVVILSVDGRIVDLNPAALRLLGIESGAKMSLPLPELMRRYEFRHLDGRPLRPDEAPPRRAIAGETFSGFEMRLRTSRGEDKIVSVSGAPVRNEAGEIILGVVIARDVTDERNRERQRDAVAEIARSLVREIELGGVAEVVMEQSLSALGADAVMLHLVDPLRREVTLLAQRNLPKGLLGAVQHLSYDDPHLCAHAASTAQIQVAEDLREAGTAPPLGDLYAREGIRSVLAVPLQSRGRIVGVLTTLSNSPRHFSQHELEFNATVADLFAAAIENAHLYTELRDALRLREEFIASAAHELKTPVTVIKGWAQMLLMANQRDPQKRKALETIDRQADRVSRFIEDMLAVASLQPGLPPQKREVFDLATLVKALVEGTSRLVEQHRFEVHAPTPLPVEADRQLVGEVLNRLLENAVRYSPAGGKVEVAALRSDGQAVVSVRDYGFGIPLDRQPYVFEPFYQPVPPGVPGYVGIVSLGLHLSKQIIETLGGRIWFNSTPGHGSTFSFSIPLAESPHAARPAGGQ